MKNNGVISIIQKEFDENINSHVFLVETNNVDKCLDEIKEVIKNILKADEIVKGQIDDENYLELIIIRPDGKDIKKDQILELQNRLKTKPIQSDKLFYIILNAESMNEVAANKLLKTIEEPAENIIGFLVSTNNNLILPTIKSRCEMIENKWTSEISDTKSDDKILEFAGSLVAYIEKNDLLKFNIKKMAETELKENGKTVVNIIKDYYNTACEIGKNDNLNSEIVKFIKENNTHDKIVKKALYINELENKIALGMNIDLLLEKLFLEIRDV